MKKLLAVIAGFITYFVLNAATYALIVAVAVEPTDRVLLNAEAAGPFAGVIGGILVAHLIGFRSKKEQ